MELEKSERGVYEPKLSEEDVLGQIVQLLTTLGAVVVRHVEPVPHCARCDHLIGKHERRFGRCRGKGCWCTLYLWSRHTAKAGIADISGYFPRLKAVGPVGNRFTYPVHFFIEVKRPGGRHRDAQTAYIEQAKIDGCCAMFADSIESMIQQFESFGVYLGVKV